MIHLKTGWTEDRPVPEEVFPDPHIAIGAGYGESKWVAEQILDTVSKNTELSTVAVRVGQVCGSRTNGSWNQWEWFPAIVQSYKVAGCLPDAAGVSSLRMIQSALVGYLSKFYRF